MVDMEMTAALLWAGHVSLRAHNKSFREYYKSNTFQARKGCDLALTSIESYASISNVRVS